MYILLFFFYIYRDVYLLAVYLLVSLFIKGGLNCSLGSNKFTQNRTSSSTLDNTQHREQSIAAKKESPQALHQKKNEPNVMNISKVNTLYMFKKANCHRPLEKSANYKQS